MILQAATEHHINLEKSYLVGDKWSDIEAGKRSRDPYGLVCTGHVFVEIYKL